MRRKKKFDVVIRLDTDVQAPQNVCSLARQQTLFTQKCFESSVFSFKQTHRGYQ